MSETFNARLNTPKSLALRKGLGSRGTANTTQSHNVKVGKPKQRKTGQRISLRVQVLVAIFGLTILLLICGIYRFLRKSIIRDIFSGKSIRDEIDNFFVHGKENAVGDTLEPAGNVAYAIPVGGKTKRLHLLRRLLQSLKEQRTNPSDIFVFEDDTSRPRSFSEKSRKALFDLCKEFQVNILRSQVVRNRKEGKNEFGLFLARHYHFMLDTLLYDAQSLPAYTANKNNEHIFGHGDPRRFLGEKNGKTKIYEYAVILEDDLELATDAVNFFSSMTWPMSRDSTIFCACAHQDNAYFAMSIEIDANAYGGKDGSSIFAFRRGEHFMAPGWMTSRSVYNKVIRPTWFDLHGELLPWARMRLYNGNWDTYLDYRVEGMECVYPSIPRIAHRGAVGYTVKKDRQDAVFGSLRLSRLDSSVETGIRYKKSAMNLIHYRYNDNIYKFIAEARVVSCLQEIQQHMRNKQVVYHLAATNKADSQWAHLFTGKLGIIAVGGHTARMRGIHQGTVFVNYMSNTVLVVATYSPYSNAVVFKKKKDTRIVAPKFLDCYADKADRDLPVLRDTSMVPINGKNPIGPEKCSCECTGYKYFALQNGGECFCGNSYGKYGIDSKRLCMSKCIVEGESTQKQAYCGGPLSNAVYDRIETLQKEKAFDAERSGMQAEDIIVSTEGESCTETCVKWNGVGGQGRFHCVDGLLPKLLFSGIRKLLVDKLNCQSGNIRDGSNSKFRNVAPAMHNDDECYTTVGRHLMCHAKMDQVKRLCVCTTI